MISIIADALIASKSFRNTLACPRYAIHQSFSTFKEKEERERDIPSGE
jgi:hypothetical protein